MTLLRILLCALGCVAACGSDGGGKTSDVTSTGPDGTADATSDSDVTSAPDATSAPDGVSDATSAAPDATNDTSTVPETGPMTIGPAGGTLVLDDGARLEVPAGALAVETMLTIDRLASGPPGAYVAYSALYVFGPPGTTFLVPVTVELPFTGDAGKAVLYWSKDESTYEPIVGTTANGLLRAPVMHFSSGFVGERTGPTAQIGDACEADAACVSGTCWPPIGAERICTKSCQLDCPAGLECRADPCSEGAFKCLRGGDLGAVICRQDFNIVLLSLPPELPTDEDIDVAAKILEPLPAGTTVLWTWSHAGVGDMQRKPDADKPDSEVHFATGSDDGSATFEVSATVTVPEREPASIFRVRGTTRVRKGLTQIRFEPQAGIFACGDPAACSVRDYTAYLVPIFAKATNYQAVFSGFTYGPCNRSLNWTRPVADEGGCSFPVTYHPHTSAGPSDTWAVWMGYGDPVLAGKCNVTITLAP